MLTILSCKKKTDSISCNENPDCNTVDLVDVKAISANLTSNGVDIIACLELCIDTLESRGVVVSKSPISASDNIIRNQNFVQFPGTEVYRSAEDLSNSNVSSGDFTMSFSSLSNSTTFYYRAFTKYKGDSPSNNISDYRVSDQKEFTTN